MKKLLGALVSVSLLMSAGFLFSQPASAQAAEECQVSGEHGSITAIGESVTGHFSIDGPEDCAETEVSLAVWVCTPEGCLADLENQRFFGFADGMFDLSDASDRGYALIASLTTALPTEQADGDGCELQVDLVRGSERADPDHPFPDGPFYDERRMLSAVIDNPACDEEQPAQVAVCDTQTGMIVQVTEEERDANPDRYGSADPIDPACLPDVEVAVCDPATGDVIVVPEDEAGDYLPVDAEECDAPGQVHVCNNDGEIILVDEEDEGDYLPVDHENCTVRPQTPPATPPNPPALPNTGVGAAAAVGVGALGASANLVWSTRRNLADALLNR